MAGSKSKFKLLFAVAVVVFGGVMVLQTSTSNGAAEVEYTNETWDVEDYSWHELDAEGNETHIQDTKVESVVNESNTSEVYREDADFEVNGSNASVRALDSGDLDAGNDSVLVTYTVEHWRGSQAAFIGLTQSVWQVVALVVLVVSVAAAGATLKDLSLGSRGGRR